MAEEKTGTEMVPARQSMAAGLTAIVGELRDRVMAFDQIALAIASSQAFPGYNDASKVKAACWAADSLAVHPVAYMTGVYAASMGGKLVMIPSVKFEDGLLRSRLPGYDYTVHEETEKACEIEFFSQGRKSQRVRFTWEDAQRAKLDQKDTYKNYPRKMLFARCFHMGAHRIGPHILAGLPDPSDYDGMVAPSDLGVSAAPREPSSATMLDDALEIPAAAGDGSGGAAPLNPSAPPPVAVAAPQAPGPVDGSKRPQAGAAGGHIVNWRQELAKTLKMIYGTLKAPALLQKASTVWAAVAHERGLDVPAAFTKPDDFGPVEAQTMVEWLRAKYPNETKAGTPAPKAAGGTEAPPAEAPAAPEEPAAIEEGPPPMNGAEEPVVDADGDVATLFELVASLNPTAGRPYVQEAPKGLRTFWFTDKETLMACEFSESLRIQKDGEQTISAEDCAKIVACLRARTLVPA